MKQIGLDLSPVAFRAAVVSASGDGLIAEPLYRPRGCARSGEYVSDDSWGDPMAFRTRTSGVPSGTEDVERTVDYLTPCEHCRDALEAYRERVQRELKVGHDIRFVGTVPDHATPDERDAVLRGLGTGAVLVWRPVAVVLHWLKARRGEGTSLCGRRIVVLDLDGENPEITEFELIRHEQQTEEIVPVRRQPKRKRLLKGAGEKFDIDCCRHVLRGLHETEQVMSGQFSSQVQKMMESEEKGGEIWVRRQHTWAREKVAFDRSPSSEVVSELEPLLDEVIGLNDPTILCVGWFARRHGGAFTELVRAKTGGEVFVMDADAVASGAAEFGRRLEAKLPTYYDELPAYRWWDGKIADWRKFFEHCPRVEPGCVYTFPKKGTPDCELKIEKNNDNVSLYVQVMTEDGHYEEDEVFAHRLKIHFAEYLKVDERVKLTASVRPDEGSASFTLTAMRPIFQSGQSRACSATLKYSLDSGRDKYLSVELVKEHQGYLEPQPVVGRIYENSDWIRMLELMVDGDSPDELRRLRINYLSSCNGTGDFIAKPFGYSPNNELSQPTRGLFGTKRIPDVNIDRVATRFADSECKRYPQGSFDWYTAQNYCCGWAKAAYKQKVRSLMETNSVPAAYGFYFAGAYVFDSIQDLRIVIDYHNRKKLLESNPNPQYHETWIHRYQKIWWAIFRALCWHVEISFTSEDVCRVQTFVDKVVQIVEVSSEQGKPISNDEKRDLILVLLYMLRIRECQKDISMDSQHKIQVMLEQGGVLGNIPFPAAMVPGIPIEKGDTLSAYFCRFLTRQDTIRDRELGAVIGCV